MKLCHHLSSHRAFINYPKGKKTYLGTWPAKDKNPPLEVLARYGAFLASLKRDVPEQKPTDRFDVPADLTVVELFARHEAWAKTAYSKSNYHKAFNWSARIVCKCFGTTLVKNFGPLKLQTILEKAATQKILVEQKSEKLTRQGVNRLLNLVKFVFRWGVSHELVPSHIYESLRTIVAIKPGRIIGLKESTRKPDITPADYEAALGVMGPVGQAVAKILRHTGMRPSELCNMRNGDLFQQGDLWVYRPDSHKTQHHGKSRIIPMGPKAWDALAPFVRPDDPNGFVFSPRIEEAKRHKKMAAERKTPRQPSQKVGVRRKRNPQKSPGECYDRYSLAKLFSRPIERWNKKNPDKPIKVFGPSVLRRLQAQEIRDRLGLEASRAVLGHSNSAITMEHYAKSDFVLAAKVAQSLG